MLRVLEIAQGFRPSRLPILIPPDIASMAEKITMFVTPKGGERTELTRLPLFSAKEFSLGAYAYVASDGDPGAFLTIWRMETGKYSIEIALNSWASLEAFMNSTLLVRMPEVTKEGLVTGYFSTAVLTS